MGDSRDRLENVLARLTDRADEERVFTTIYADEARLAADAADARRSAGTALGPLDGRIVTIKDLLDVAGETTLAGSRAFATRPPASKDAAVVSRLRMAGAVILAKTNMVEFAYSGLGINPHFGTPGNAADGSRVPGGSSSGAGVTIAEGTSEISIGSDTGGSVRIPAALNGVVGFKPTAGRVPLDGAFPLSYTLDSLGPLALSVADCAATDAVMAGEEPRPLEPVSLDGLQVGIPKGRLLSEMDPVVTDGYERALAVLRRNGATVRDFPIEDLLDSMREATYSASIAALEASAVHADWLQDLAPMIDPLVYKSIARASGIPAHVYIRTMRRRAELVRDMDHRLCGIDVLALPTTPVVAPETAPLLADHELYHRTDWQLLRNPMIANQFDLTSISLPVPDTALPVGFMLFARHGHDQRLLAIAAAVEDALRG